MEVFSLITNSWEHKEAQSVLSVAAGGGRGGPRRQAKVENTAVSPSMSRLTPVFSRATRHNYISIPSGENILLSALCVSCKVGGLNSLHAKMHTLSTKWPSPRDVQ